MQVQLYVIWIVRHVLGDNSLNCLLTSGSSDNKISIHSDTERTTAVVANLKLFHRVNCNFNTIVAEWDWESETEARQVALDVQAIH